MKVATIIKAFAWVGLLIGFTLTLFLGISNASALERAGQNPFTFQVIIYYLIGIPSSLIGSVLLYGFGNIVEYCEKRLG